MTVRISRQVRGTAEPLLTELWGPEGFRSTLLLAPPGAGKTTLLRDMICALSDGSETRPPAAWGWWTSGASWPPCTGACRSWR